jgi:hypothetical protein
VAATPPAPRLMKSHRWTTTRNAATTFSGAAPTARTARCTRVLCSPRAGSPPEQAGVPASSGEAPACATHLHVQTATHIQSQQPTALFWNSHKTIQRAQKQCCIAPIALQERLHSCGCCDDRHKTCHRLPKQGENAPLPPSNKHRRSRLCHHKGLRQHDAWKGAARGAYSCGSQKVQQNTGLKTNQA